MNWYEDIALGETFELGSHLFTAEDIMRFARAYDPQPFHTDPEAAKRSHFGGLCASGWHTTAVWMRLMVRHARREAETARREGRTTGRIGPSPGFEMLRWLKPVYAGQTIRFRTTIQAKRDIPSQAGWGFVQFLNEGFNEADEPVISFIGAVLMERKVPAGPD